MFSTLVSRQSMEECYNNKEKKYELIIFSNQIIKD